MRRKKRVILGIQFLWILWALSSMKALSEGTPPANTPVDQGEDAAKKSLELAENSVMAGLEKMSIVVDFARNKSLLTSEEKKDIKKMLDAQDNRSYKAYVAAWADVDKVELSKKSNANLAKKRVEVLDKYIRNSGFKGEIVGINMDSESGLFSKVFKTESSQMKNALDHSRSDVDLKHHRIAEVIKSKGGKSKAVLILAE